MSKHNQEDEYTEMRKVCIEQARVYTTQTLVPDPDSQTWHQLKVVRSFDPETGKTVLVLVQSDTTKAKRATEEGGGKKVFHT